MEGDRQEQRGSAPDPAGGNNSPRSPLILLRSVAASAGRGERKDCVRNGAKGQVGRAFCASQHSGTPGGELFFGDFRCFGRAAAFRAAVSVQTGAAAPACGGRLLSVKGRTVVPKERISGCWGRSFFQVWRSFFPEVVCCFGCFSFFAQRSGLRGKPSGGRAGGCGQL